MFIWTPWARTWRFISFRAVSSPDFSRRRSTGRVPSIVMMGVVSAGLPGSTTRTCPSIVPSRYRRSDMIRPKGRERNVTLSASTLAFISGSESVPDPFALNRAVPVNVFTSPGASSPPRRCFSPSRSRFFPSTEASKVRPCPRFIFTATDCESRRRISPVSPAPTWFTRKAAPESARQRKSRYAISSVEGKMLKLFSSTCALPVEPRR